MHEDQKGSIYNDKYKVIDNNMSDSNVGTRKNKNIRNHIIVINGIIHDVLLAKKKRPIDIQIMDYKQSCPFKMVSSILCTTIDDYLYLWVIVRGSCILWSVLICVASSHGLGNYPFRHVEDGWSGADDPPSVASMVPCFMS